MDDFYKANRIDKSSPRRGLKEGWITIKKDFCRPLLEKYLQLDLRRLELLGIVSSLVSWIFDLCTVAAQHREPQYFNLA